MKKHIIPILILIAITCFTSCEDDPITPTPTPTGSTTAWLLNEGVWGMNNAELSLVDLDDIDITNDYFTAQNGRGLGDVAQDMVLYGGKMYITVYQSNSLEVINPNTGKSLKHVSLGQKGPRYIACHNGKIYISCYDKSVIRLDTTFVEIESTCPLSGMQPEQLCICGNNLYVCNSWQHTSDGGSEYDSTLSVIDLSTFTESQRITVGCNPQRIKAIDNNHLVVACNGDYAAQPAQTFILNTTDNSQQLLDVALTNFDVCNGNIYGYATTYDVSWNTQTSFYKVSITGQKTPFLEGSESLLSNAYGITIHPTDGRIFVCNSPYGQNGDLYCFNKESQLMWKLEAGNLPSKVVLQ